MILEWLILSLIIPSTSPKNAVLYCDDSISKFTAAAGNLVLTNLEFPITQAVAPGESAVADLAVPKVMHPCYSLSNSNNYKNQFSDIFNYGDFATQVCEGQCAHFVDAARLECGERRPPPEWLIGSVIGPKRKMNCSNWAIPITEKGVKDGIFFTFMYSTFATGNGDDVDPPYTMDNLSLAYLDTMFMKAIHMKPTVDPAKKDQAITEMEDLLDKLIERHPEVVHVAFGNPVVFFGDAYRNQSKYFAPRFVPSSKLWTSLGKVPKLTSLALSLIDISGNENIPSGMTENLKAIGLYNITLKAIPSWVQSDQLQFLEFSATLSDTTDMTVLENLPGLEHFLLSESTLSNIKSPFLPKSTKLLSLTLQCNAIKTIASGAFDHFTELKYLNLAGNQFVTLPENLLVNLHNLLTLDLKALDNSSLTLQTYMGSRMQCQTTLKPPSPPPVLTSMPNVPNPENIVALDVRGQYNFLKQNQKFLKQFKNVEVLNLGNLGLTNVHNISLEALCKLTELNLVSNPLSDTEWLGEDIFVNINLAHLRIGTPTSLVSIPNSLIAYMRTSSQILYDTPKSLADVTMFKYKTGCDYDTTLSATMFGYQLFNSSCADDVKAAIQKIRAMEMIKMETNCQ